MRDGDTTLATRALRITRLGLHLLHGIMTAALVLPRLDKTQQQHLARRWSARLLETLNIRVTVHGEVPTTSQAGTLFVANHISWIDIWALKQFHPVHFIAKAEIRDWPVLGWLAVKAGTLFIERERRHDTGRVVNAVEQSLAQGECLCFFPEGTTTDGTELRPFKASLLQAAINAQAMVWPLAIRYPRQDGRPNTAIAYHGEVTMLQSLWEVLKQRETLVELHFVAPIPAADRERRHLSQQARHAISSLLNLPAHRVPETRGDLPDAAR